MTDYQRLDHWMWCARLLRTRAACARHIEQTGLRINRQVTEKPHAKLRPGDVLTFAIGAGAVRVIRVRALAERRGPAAAARALFEEIADDTDLSGGETGGISRAPAPLGGGQQDLGY